MSDEKYKAYYEFIGGQNSAAAPDNLSDNEVREIINMDVVVRGAVKTRDGTTEVPWTCLASEDSPLTFRDVVYGNSTYVAVASSGSYQCATSPDGVTWTKRALAAGKWSSITFGAGIFVATDETANINTVRYSTDGITWTSAPMMLTGTARRVRYVNNAFVCLGSYSDTKYRFTTADSSMNWGTANYQVTDKALYATTLTFTDIAYGNNIAIILGSTSTENWAYTASAVWTNSWTRRALPAISGKWDSIAFGNGVFMALSTDGKFAKSTDGITWTLIPGLSPAGQWYNIAYVTGSTDNCFVAVGSEAPYIMKVGSTSSVVSPATNVPVGTWSGVTVSATKIVATSRDTTNNIVNAAITNPLTYTPYTINVVNAIRRTAELVTTSGTRYQLVLCRGNLYNRNSGTPLLTGCGDHMDYTTYNNKMYLFIKNGYYVYDGATIALVTNGQGDSQLATIQKCKYICARAERIFAAGNPDAPNTIYYTQVGDPTYFKTGQFMVQAASGDGSVISGLKEYNEAMLVFKTRGVWAWFGYSITTDVKLVRLNMHSGAKAYRTIQNVNNTLFFLGDDGVYAMRSALSGAIDTVKISLNIDDRFKNLYFPDTPSDSSACAIYKNGKYYLGYCIKTGDALQDLGLNNRVAVCHVDAGLEGNKLPWTIYEGAEFGDVLDSSDRTLYFAHATKPTFFKFDETSYTDMGFPINFKFTSKAYDAGSPIHLKKYKRAWMTLNQDMEEASTYNAKILIDYAEARTDIVIGAESLVWDKGTWDFSKWDWIDTVTKTTKISQKGIRVNFELTGTTTLPDKNRLFLYGLAFMFKIKKPYKEVQ